MLLKLDTFCIVRTASNSLYLKKRQVKKERVSEKKPSQIRRRTGGKLKMSYRMVQAKHLFRQRSMTTPLLLLPDSRKKKGSVADEEKMSGTPRGGDIFPPPATGGSQSSKKMGGMSASVATMTALMVCFRFSASSNTMEFGDSNTSSVTSRASSPNFR